jgi:hypothetical protein
MMSGTIALMSSAPMCVSTAIDLSSCDDRQYCADPVPYAASGWGPRSGGPAGPPLGC